MLYPWKNIIKNRELLLTALRSGKFKKGTTRSDSKGFPIVSTTEDEGYCACAIMLELFPTNNLEYRNALDISAEDCRLIQQKWNDEEDLSFTEIADRIEKFIFGNRFELNEIDHEYSKTMYDSLG